MILVGDVREGIPLDDEEFRDFADFHAAAIVFDAQRFGGPQRRPWMVATRGGRCITTSMSDFTTSYPEMRGIPRMAAGSSN